MTTLITESVALYLHNTGLGVYNPTGAGGTIYLDELPHEPAAALAIAQYGGDEASASLPYDTVSIQVRVRAGNGDRRTAALLAQSMYDQLHGLGGVELPGGLWLCLCVGAQGGPIYLGRDQNERPEWTINFRAEFHRPTPHRSSP